MYICAGTAEEVLLWHYDSLEPLQLGLFQVRGSLSEYQGGLQCYLIIVYLVVFLLINLYSSSLVFVYNIGVVHLLYCSACRLSPHLPRLWQAVGSANKSILNCDWGWGLGSGSDEFVRRVRPSPPPPQTVYVRFFQAIDRGGSTVDHRKLAWS